MGFQEVFPDQVRSGEKLTAEALRLGLKSSRSTSRTAAAGGWVVGLAASYWRAGEHGTRSCKAWVVMWQRSRSPSTIAVSSSIRIGRSLSFALQSLE